MSPAPRVLVIPSWYPSESAPTAGIFIKQQVRALTEVADVAVLHVDAARSDSPPTIAREDGVTVVRSSIKAKGLYKRFFGYRSAGQTAYEALTGDWGTPDIIHVQALFPAAMIARDISRRGGPPYVVTEHSEEYLARSPRRLVRTPGMLPLVLRPLARGASRTIAVSRFLAERLTELGLAQDPIVIPNVVPVSPAAPLPTATPHRIAHVSIMSPAKRLDLLLEAASMLRKRRADFELLLVGDGECREDLERMSADLGSSSYVRFAGRISAEGVRAELARCAFSVVSSSHETFSVAAAESLMCGRPVLSTRCGGPEEFITPEVGELIAADDAKALADGMDRMLDSYTHYDPQALHEYARDRFAPEVVAESILGVYRSVLGT